VVRDVTRWGEGGPEDEERVPALRGGGSGA
jgi:hypothetical protein